MTTIKATCPCCGEVSLTPPDITLCVDPHDAEPATYAFDCPGCGDIVRKTADDRVVRLLISGGVDPQSTPRTAPMRTLAERFEGPELTHDDLLDFHGLLREDDWFDRLVASTREGR
jgi:hypothetical protein